MSYLEDTTKYTRRLEKSGCMKCSARCPDRRIIPKSVAVGGTLKGRTTLILLSHPRESDEIAGRILKGADSDVLKGWLRYGAYPNIYITSAVKCRTEDDRTPTKKEINTCAVEHLYKELRLINPISIIAMGKVAIKALFNCTEAQAKEKLGNVYSHEVSIKGESIWKGKIYTTYHPGFFKMSAGYTDAEEAFSINNVQQCFKENYE